MSPTRSAMVVAERGDGSAADEQREAEEPGRGREADRPSDIPAPGWKDIAVRVKDGVRDDNVVLIAAGLAFFGILSLGPAMLALVSIYGLFASPDDVARQFESMTGAIPKQARHLFEEQLRQIASTAGSQLGIQAAVGLEIALWAASTGIKHLFEALSTIHDEHE